MEGVVYNFRKEQKENQQLRGQKTEHCSKERSVIEKI
jgi:hypothetical protein